MRLAPIRLLACLAWGATLPGCGGDEAAPEQHGTPVSARLFRSGLDVTQALTLGAGETARVEVRFYDDQGNQITGIESEHFAALTFTPPTLVTVTDVEGLHFQKDLTAAGQGGSGTYSIGYGHDAAADEKSFGPYNVAVAPPGEARR